MFADGFWLIDYDKDYEKVEDGVKIYLHNADVQSTPGLDYYVIIKIPSYVYTGNPIQIQTISNIDNYNIIPFPFSYKYYGNKTTVCDPGTHTVTVWDFQKRLEFKDGTPVEFKFNIINKSEPQNEETYYDDNPSKNAKLFELMEDRMMT